MSNEVNNLASSFVAMAQAFEKLPIVQSQLDHANTMIENYANHIQQLELRLIDRANELDAAHAATRKMEVERDHAETMFLETDDKLARAKDVLASLIGNASAFIRAVEPQPEPVPTPVIEPQVSEGSHYTEAEHAYPLSEPTPVQGQSEQGPTASTSGTFQSPDVSGVEKPTETVEAVSHTDPIANSTAGVGPSFDTAPVGSATADVGSPEPTQTQPSEAVSVQPDPTQVTESSSESGSNVSTGSAPQPEPLDPWPYKGKRYTDVPFYVSLVEWLNGGGTEEAYYAR